MDLFDLLSTMLISMTENSNLLQGVIINLQQHLPDILVMDPMHDLIPQDFPTSVIGTVAKILTESALIML